MSKLTFKTLVVKSFENETFDWSNKVTEDEIAFIVDEADRIIYVWIGQNTSIVKKYKGGTLATKIKSQYQFYGFKTQTVNQGEETGSLKEEVARLLGGKGSAPSESEKAAKAPVAAPTPSPAPAPAPRPVEHALIAQREAEFPPAKPSVSASSNRIKELEEELENEKKLSVHRATKMKEERETLKADLEAQIHRLAGELDDAKKAADEARKAAEMKPQVDPGIQQKIEHLQQELNNFKEIQAKHDELLSLSEGLEKNNKDLKNTISALQSEITELKSRLEAAGKVPGASDEIQKLKDNLEKEKIASIDARVESKKKLEATIAEYENKVKALENKVASYKEQLEKNQRDTMKKEEGPVAPLPAVPKPASAENELDFITIPEEDAPADNAGLLFVNPYATGEIGSKIDPLQDLKSFLNTVDPSKPLDPELKKLLEIIAEN
nr:hypothetical protein [Candidatus Sigynarchaeota archaeon]